MHELHLDFGRSESSGTVMFGESLRKRTLDVAALRQTCALCQEEFPVITYREHMCACLGFNPSKESQLRFPFPLSA